MSVPRRGEVWLVALGAARAGEPGKHRPAVVVSASALHSGSPHDLVSVVPLSSSAAPGPLRPVVTPAEGVDAPSLAMCRAIRGVATSRLAQQVGAVHPPTLERIDDALRQVLDLNPSGRQELSTT